jgi:2,4-dienoyl-CoA reductase-like NADH-dependent reductase (Old Yellow Enzyme family)
VGGAGLIICEATAVCPEGRISPYDLGIYKDEHVEGLARINHFIKQHGASPAIQLAHAGRKASMSRPWDPHRVIPASEGGWERVVGPSPIAFSDSYLTPSELTKEEIHSVIRDFVNATKRALAAGFEVIEIHGAHGYLVHEFLSPLSNHRQDEYGGSFENRTRFVRELVSEVRTAWPENLPLMIRLSATDWTEGGWNLEQTVEFSKILHDLGVDLIDCSSGGNVAQASIPVAPGYQVSFAEAVRKAGVPSAAVGLITEPEQADSIVRNGQADLVLLAREFLRDPHWPHRAAKALGVDVDWPNQYVRAKR